LSQRGALEEWHGDTLEWTTLGRMVLNTDEHNPNCNFKELQERELRKGNMDKNKNFNSSDQNGQESVFA